MLHVLWWKLSNVINLPPSGWLITLMNGVYVRKTKKQTKPSVSLLYFSLFSHFTTLKMIFDISYNQTGGVLSPTSSNSMTPSRCPEIELNLMLCTWKKHQTPQVKAQSHKTDSPTQLQMPVTNSRSPGSKNLHDVLQTGGSHDLLLLGFNYLLKWLTKLW